MPETDFWRLSLKIQMSRPAIIATATRDPPPAPTIQALFFEGVPVKPGVGAIEAMAVEIVAVGVVVGEVVIAESIVVEID